VFEVGGVGFGGSLDHMGHYPIRDSIKRTAPAFLGSRLQSFPYITTFRSLHIYS
jgi:hypothetical protein